ncbi:MAG: endolytic transglycosylase MltG [Chitinispirillaceae bacterium]|jgi:UPF0755 protein
MKRQPMRKFSAISFLILLLAVLGSGTYVLFPLPGFHEKETIVIHRGCTVRAMADSLALHDVIAWRPALLAWLRWSGVSRRIHAGKYTFIRRSGVIAAAHELANVLPNETVVTVPEGLTIEQTAARIAAALPIDTTEFIGLCLDSTFARTVGPTTAASLEGFLFPDTYAFIEGTTPSEIIRRMVGRFRQKWAAEIDSASFSAHGMTELQIVTLASIVEKEAVVAAERPRIAGVFFNRLRRKMTLGADPTVRYVFRKFNGPLLARELTVASPYNTRKYAGLPPGPICSPGLASLQAAVSPLRTNELYFVAKWDGSGEHDFSVTNEEHGRKKMAIRYKNQLRLRQKEASCRQ